MSDNKIDISLAKVKNIESLRVFVACKDKEDIEQIMSTHVSDKAVFGDVIDMDNGKFYTYLSQVNQEDIEFFLLTNRLTTYNDKVIFGVQCKDTQYDEMKNKLDELL